MKTSVYLAGPITKGNVLANVHQSLVWTQELKNRGFITYTPHWGSIQEFYSPWGYEEWLSWDFYWLEKCDALFRMVGDSLGADREEVFANQKGIPVFYENQNGLYWLEEWRAKR